MLVGTASLDVLAAAAPRLEAFAEVAIVLEDVVCLQLTAEMHNGAREAVLPPALHPTIPPTLSLQVWDVGSSPFGAFALALCRVSCRSGVRARGFTTAAVVSTSAAGDLLQGRFGFPCTLGSVSLRRHYDGVDVQVEQGGSTTLAIAALDPDPMGSNDVQYTGTLNLAHTPLGLRLVQVEAEHAASRVERLSARLTAFEPEAWGSPLLDPYFVVSASVALERLTLEPVRFVCKADELAFTGTEAVSPGA